MPDEDSCSSGLFYSLRRLGGTFLGIVKNRVELVTLEAAEERDRLAAILVGAALAGVFALMGLIALTFLLVVAFWAQAIWVLLGFVIVYACCGFAAYCYVQGRLKEPFFPETVAQLEEDRQWIFPQK